MEKSQIAFEFKNKYKACLDLFSMSYLYRVNASMVILTFEEEKIIVRLNKLLVRGLKS